MVDLPAHLRSTGAGTEKVPREVLESHQRERVVALVTPVFAKRGYEGTTVEDLFAAGKVGVGNFYDLFGSKEECFVVAYDRVLEAVRSQIELAAASAREDWDGRTYLGLRALIAFVLERPLEARLVLIEAPSAGEAALSRYNALLDEALAWLRRGRDGHREARSLPRGFERAAVLGLAFYLQQCLLDSRAHEAEELFGEVANLVLEPILGRRALARLRDSLAAVR
jgi:AcrR family transcriptional regulator